MIEPHLFSSLSQPFTTDKGQRIKKGPIECFAPWRYNNNAMDLIKHVKIIVYV